MMYIDSRVLVILICQVALLVESAYDREKFKRIVKNDKTNDDALDLDAQGLLTRSGYDYENYNVTSDDGYITQIVRIINPLADRAQLRRPPVLLFPGANIDITCYLSASSIQHHPEPYPRTAADGPITSSNRSLGFMLANNGFDVFLIGVRGSNVNNQDHTKNEFGINTVYNPNNEGKNMSVGETAYEFARTPLYWQYGQDDVIAHEIKNQIDLVRSVTGSEEMSIFSFSISTGTTLAFLAQRPEYARNVRVYIQMGPAIAASHFTRFGRAYFEKLCPRFPTRGIGFTPTYTLLGVARPLIYLGAQSVKIRYSLIYSTISTLFGPSPKYLTNLERNMLSHVLVPTSFKTVQQYCQNSVARSFRKFDYGLLGNQAIYGQSEPPVYNTSYIDVQHHAVVYGTLDALADVDTSERVIANVKSQRKPIRIVADMFNHLDLIAGVEVDTQINLPVLDVLDKFSD